MRGTQCDRCLFGDKCRKEDSHENCSNYSPIDELEDLSDGRIAGMIQQGRREYESAWREYIYSFYN